MNPTNEQELDEILTKLENAVALNIGSQGMRGEAPKRSHWKAKAAIQAHTNAEIAKVLDRLETEMPSKRNTLVGDAYQRTFCNEYNKALKEVSKVIQAERTKLKEVK